jgi:methylthioribose-1-phosphate isomerase
MKNDLRTASAYHYTSIIAFWEAGSGHRLLPISEKMRYNGHGAKNRSRATAFTRRTMMATKKQQEDLAIAVLDDENDALVILDQTLLPGEVKYIKLRTLQEVRDAICLLKVRGAPAIGVAAAYGLYLAIKPMSSDDYARFADACETSANHLASSRPTAVNLKWALDRMKNTMTKNRDKPVPVLLELLKEESLRIHREDEDASKSIGEHAGFKHLA